MRTCGSTLLYPDTLRRRQDGFGFCAITELEPTAYTQLLAIALVSAFLEDEHRCGSAVI